MGNLGDGEHPAAYEQVGIKYAVATRNSPRVYGVSPKQARALGARRKVLST